jgi:hypothetical protein
MIEAADGQAGVARAKAERPDLILMDIQLPVLDAYEGKGVPSIAVPIEPLPKLARWSQQIWPFALPRRHIEQTNV